MPVRCVVPPPSSVLPSLPPHCPRQSRESSDPLCGATHTTIQTFSLSLSLSLSRTRTLRTTHRYCGSKSNLTIDHVIPSSRGGEWRYDNLVAACSKCNTKKGSKLPSECRMHPRRKPCVPKFFSVGVINSVAETVITGKAFPLEWASYMPRPEKFFEA